MKYKPTIGLEIHIELKTNSKMFCGCVNNPDEERANFNVCPVCMAHPGTLPVVNKEAIKKVIKTGLALNSEIKKNTFFERKNYFYPDLPKGYQISQYLAPLCEGGYLKLKSGKKVSIERVHLEEDTAKLLHSDDNKSSLIDFNRAGVPLMELVTKPDIESADEAREFVKALRAILRYLDVSGANMEKGEMRAEVNISIAKEGAKELGTKVEIKNLNSIKAVEKSIETEIVRQQKVLEAGDKVVQETRGFKDAEQTTFSQRKKEQAHDYRYFPEPDLPPLELSDELIKNIKSEIPELPQDKMIRFEGEYGLSDKQSEMFALERELGEYFEKVISELKVWLKQKSNKQDDEQKDIKLAANYISTDLQYLLKGTELEEEKFSISAENFAEFLAMIFTGEISSKIAKVVLKEMFEKGGDPSQIIKAQGLEQITDTSEIESIAQEIINSNPEPVGEYKKGKITALQFLIGQLMAKTKGKANPQVAKEILEGLLK